MFNQLVQDKDFQIPSVSNKITDLIEKNSFAFQYKQDSISFNPISLNINSQLDEYFPSMPINSDIIIYTSRDKTTRFQDEDFFISRKENNLWSKPIRLGKNINSEYICSYIASAPIGPILRLVPPLEIFYNEL